MDANFWPTIKESGGDPEKLKALLKEKLNEDVIAFGRTFYQLLINLNRWEIWGAGYVMAGGMSDDSFHYFRSWIIGKGEEAYETALKSPDDLGRFAGEDDDFDNELLEYVAVEVLEERGVEDPRESPDGFADDEPKGEEWDEDEVYAKYPKLAAQFE